MNFEFNDEQKLLRDQARKFLTDACPTKAVRAILDGPEPYDRALWGRIAEQGWLGTAIPEAYGGLGFGHLELCVIAEELGRVLAPVPVSSSIYLAAEALLLAGTEAQKAHWLPKLASGEAIGTLAAAERAGPVVPRAVAATLAGGALTGTKIAVPDGLAATLAIVVVRDGEGLSLALVDLTGPGVTREAVQGVDNSRKLATLTFAGARAEPLGASGDGVPLLRRLEDRAAVLFAFEQLGGAERALEIAVEYAKGRYAFGRPIGSFQAIKHKLADMYCAKELARSNAYYGAWALAADAPELPLAAATARVSACQAYYQCAKETIQTHGGMGFTWEVDAHLFYRRAKLLSLVIGGEPLWKDRLVAQLERRNLPLAA